MHRFAGALLGLLVPFFPVAGCFPQDCKMDDASPTVYLTAHIPISASELPGASASFCRNGNCAQGTVSANLTLSLTGPMGATATVEDERDGYVENRVRRLPPRRSEPGTSMAPPSSPRPARRSSRSPGR